MTTSSFDKRVLIEQLRYIEAQDTLADADSDFIADSPAHGDFDNRLWDRAQHLIERNDLKSKLGRSLKFSHLANILALFVAAVLGGLAASVAVDAGDSINIYWLLLVLLGFNLLSMLLWLVGISFDLEGLSAGILAKLLSWLPERLSGKGEMIDPADRAWLAVHYGGRVGKWQFSKITHQLWLVYLLAGLSVLILLLMARQYDFVWGTTLLSDAAFINMTEMMGRPLEALGLTIPSAQQVQETRTGADQILSAAHRYAWSQFLLGALLCYGIVPRLLLWVWSVLLHRVAVREFKLDYYLPYYISLRQLLMPLAGHGHIVDADSHPPAAVASTAANPTPHKLPEDIYWISVELGNDISWPPAAIDTNHDLGQAVDRESFARIQQRVSDSNVQSLAIVVAADRPPDRGVQRSIASLLEGREEGWLVLLQKRNNERIAESRLGAWYRLAEICNVPADQVISMSAEQ